jgi:hypothetical protein
MVLMELMGFIGRNIMGKKRLDATQRDNDVVIVGPNH